MSEPLHGKGALVKHLNAGAKLVFRSDIHDVLANNEHLVALMHAVVETDEGDVDLSHAEVIHMEDGLIVKRQVFLPNLHTALSVFGTEESCGP